MPKHVLVDGLQWITETNEINLPVSVQMPDDTPYLYIKGHVTTDNDRKVRVDIRIKFETDGVIVDVFDDITGTTEPDSSTYSFYNDLCTQEEFDEESVETLKQWRADHHGDTIPVQPE